MSDSVDTGAVALADAAPEAAIDDSPAAGPSAKPGPLDYAEGEAPETAENPEEEKAKEEAPKKDPEAVKKEEARAKQLAQLMRHEADLRRKTADFERREKELQTSYEAKHRELESRHSKLEAWQKDAVDYLVRAKQDPIGWLQSEFGIDPERYYEMAMNGGKPTKDHEQSDGFKNLQSRYDALEKRFQEKELQEAQALENWKKAQAEERRKAEAAAAEAEYVKAQDEFWGAINANPKDFPDILLYPKDVVLAEAARLVTQLGAKAENMSYNELARVMDDITREWHVKVRGGSAAAQKESPAAQSVKSEPEKTSAKPADTTKTRRSAGNYGGDAIKTKTLNGDLAASRASVKVGRSFEEEKAALKRELEASGG